MISYIKIRPYRVKVPKDIILKRKVRVTPPVGLVTTAGGLVKDFGDLGVPNNGY
jgi:hypothetical protein